MLQIVSTQVNWDLINERQESIRLCSPDYLPKTQTRAFSYPTYEEVYRHVFVHTAAENSGWIVYGNSRWIRALIGGIQCQGTSFYFENAEILKCWCPIVVLKESNVIDDISVAVLKVLS